MSRKGDTLKGGQRTPVLALQNWGVPVFSVVEDWVLVPDPCGLVAADLFQVFCGARIGPFLPTIGVSVVHWIVVNVIHRSPKVSIVPDVTVCNARPDLTAARLFFAVPLEGKSTVHAAQF